VLDRLGLAGRARYVERATLPSQRVLDLADIPADSVPYFAMILLEGAAGRSRLR
jgi:precorrin-2/cobalt-factor-2 C20-methyltransferase